MVTDPRCDFATDPIAIASTKPCFSWRLTPPGPAATGPLQQLGYRLRVASEPALLSRDKPDCWDSGFVEDTSGVPVDYDGSALACCRRYWWDANVSCRGPNGETASSTIQGTFDVPPLEEADWKGAQWLGVQPMWAGRPVYFRTVFHLETPDLSYGRLYLAGLGCHEVWLNDQPLHNADRVLEPPPTDYAQRVLFNTYDIESAAVPGFNRLIILCGPGWFGLPQFRARLLIRHKDGSEWNLLSGVPTCQFFARPGGWLSAGLYDGEVYDARLHPTHWLSSTEVNGWRYRSPAGTARTESPFNARRVSAPAGRLVPHTAEPICIMRRIRPVSWERKDDGIIVMDFGENLAGFVEVRPRLASGCSITLTFAEFLDPSGRPDQTNLYTAACRDVYVCSGEPDEVYRPRFTYHGFRYVGVSGYLDEPQGDTFLACSLRSATPTRGEFTCSDPLLTRLQANIVRCEAANQHGLLSDCPQRAERMGWLNDPTARLSEAVHNFDLNRLLEKWLGDIADTQDADGAIADTAPFHWGSRPADPVCIAPALIPWLLWRHHGNRRVLRDFYPMAVRWHAFLTRLSKDGILDYSLYGDWCPPVEFGAPNDHGNSISRDTPGRLVSTALWLELTELLEKIAHTLGHMADAKGYRSCAVAIRAAFHARFFDSAKGGYGMNNQAANALALCRRIPPPGSLARVVESLAADVVARGHHLTTGNICTKYLLDALSLNGRGDLALALARQTTYPSWGHMIEQGATTLWERWELNTSAGMNSHNHPMLGSVGGWFYEYLLGIRDDESDVPGARFTLAPLLAPELSFVHGSLDTLRGRISLGWHRTENNRVRLEIQVPPGSHATLHLPGNPSPRLLSAGRHEIMA